MVVCKSIFCDYKLRARTSLQGKNISPCPATLVLHPSTLMRTSETPPTIWSTRKPDLSSFKVWNVYCDRYYMEFSPFYRCNSMTADVVYMLYCCCPYLTPPDLLTLTEILVARLLSLDSENCLKGKFSFLPPKKVHAWTFLLCPPL